MNNEQVTAARRVMRTYQDAIRMLQTRNADGSETFFLSLAADPSVRSGPIIVTQRTPESEVTSAFQTAAVTILREA